MYIKRIRDENVGPIEKIDIAFPFTDEGKPKPVILVGENGSGKSTFISNIVDAFYLIANKFYNNAMKRDNENNKRYFKTIIPVEIRTGSKYMYSYVELEDLEQITYLLKAGNVSRDYIEKEMNISLPLNMKWEDGDMYKDVELNKSRCKHIFEKNVICYFPPNRYEKPVWLGNNYYDLRNFEHIEIHGSIDGILETPIETRNITEINLQWLLDVIVDSRADIYKVDGKIMINDADFVLSLKKARENVEYIMSEILGEGVCFSLSHRGAGITRLRIVRNNYSDSIVIPTLESLSTGQIALFNMFSTIVRYADADAVRKSVALDEIEGIVVIDEIELHLHTKLQKEVLPKLLKLFPKVQFIITTHSPMFLLGMQETFGDNNFAVYDMPGATQIGVERFSEFQRAYKYLTDTQTFQNDMKEKLKQFAHENNMLIVTEGSTDWKHIKAAYNSLKDDERYANIFENLNFDFFEYEPENSETEAEYKIEMGNRRLLELCKGYSELPHRRKYVFIVDSDVENIAKEMRGNNGRYKKWKNNVFSFVIPTPQNRKDTPNISIEHLYSDEEIKTECIENGIRRRLYMSNEFDERGISNRLSVFHEHHKTDTNGNIAIIDDKVTKMDDANINCALSKSKFASFVLKKEAPFDNFNFDNFVEIFRILKDITEDGNA